MSIFHDSTEEIAVRRAVDVEQEADRALLETDRAFLARIGVTDEQIAAAEYRMARPVEEVQRRLVAILRLGGLT